MGLALTSPLLIAGAAVERGGNRAVEGADRIRGVGGRLSTDVFVIRADATGLEDLTPNNVSNDDPGLVAQRHPDRVQQARGRPEHADLRDGARRQQSTPSDPGAGSTFDSTPSWSPDGKRIAFARKGAIFVMAADGSGQRRLTHPTRSELHSDPAWSADGKQIVFERNYQSIYVMGADGSRQRRLTTIPGRSPAWSPDGKQIAFAASIPRTHSAKEAST